MRGAGKSPAGGTQRGRGPAGAPLQERIDGVPAVIDQGQRQRRNDIARWATRHDRVRAGGRGTTHRLPRNAEPAKLRECQLGLEAGKQEVFLVPNIVAQERHQATQKLLALRRAVFQRLQARDQLVDLLMLHLVPQRELVAVRHHPADDRPPAA